MLAINFNSVNGLVGTLIWNAIKMKFEWNGSVDELMSDSVTLWAMLYWLLLYFPVTQNTWLLFSC